MALVAVALMTVAMMYETVMVMVETRASMTEVLLLATEPRFEIATIVALAQGVLGNMAVRSALVDETVWSLAAV